MHKFCACFPTGSENNWRLKSSEVLHYLLVSIIIKNDPNLMKFISPHFDAHIFLHSLMLTFDEKHFFFWILGNSFFGTPSRIRAVQYGGDGIGGGIPKFLSSPTDRFVPLLKYVFCVLHLQFPCIGTSGRRSSQSTFGRSIGNDVSGH